MIITGICWTGFGVITSRNVERNVSVPLVLGTNSALCGAAALIYIALKGMLPLHLSGHNATAFWLYFGCGICNIAAYALMGRSMRLVNNGIVWAIAQSAMICPFLMGIAVFQVEARLTRFVGLAILLAGVAAMATTKGKQSAAGGAHYWLWLVLVNFILAGLAQCLASIPSYWAETQAVNPAIKTFAMQLGNVFGCLILFPMQIFSRQHWKGVTVPAALYAALNFINQFFIFYTGIELLAKANAGSIAYPIGLGVCVLGVFIYSAIARHETNTPAGNAGFFACLTGIIVISL